MSEEGWSAENLLELSALERMIERSRGFTLAFAAAAEPRLRERILAAVRARFPEKAVQEAHLAARADQGIVDQLEAQVPADRLPGALFVAGLDATIDLRSGRDPALAGLNLNRDYFASRFPVAVVFWVSDFALREVARQVPDFWSFRSGSFRFAGEEEDARALVDRFGREGAGALGHERKLERREILRQLLARPQPPGVRARLLALAGDLDYFLDEYSSAADLYGQALPVYREIGARLGEANALLGLSHVAENREDLEEAVQLGERAAAIYEKIGLPKPRIPARPGKAPGIEPDSAH